MVEGIGEARDMEEEDRHRDHMVAGEV